MGRQNRTVGVKLGLEGSRQRGGSLLRKSTGSGKAYVSSEGSAAGSTRRLVEIRGVSCFPSGIAIQVLLSFHLLRYGNLGGHPNLEGILAQCSLRSL